MTTRVVVSRNDGRGGLRIPVNNPKDFTFADFAIDGRTFKVTTDGRVNIPKSIMKKYGTKLSDGKYALAIDVGYRYDDGKLKVGGYINILEQDKEYLNNMRTGETISYRDINPDSDVISPTTDGTEYYTALD